MPHSPKIFFYPPTFSRLFASPEAPANFAGMLNIMGLHFDNQGSDVTTAGVMAVPLIKRRLAAVLTLEEGYAGNEFMDVFLRYLDTDGNSVQVATARFDSTSTPDPGTYTDELDIPDIPAGRVLQFVRDYQPGPGPKNDQMTILLQLF